MSDRPDDKIWHWIMPDGQQVSGPRSELRSKLKERTLLPTTRVWTQTWAEWLPANRTRELSDVLPETHRGLPQNPKRDRNATSPPSVRHSIAPPRPGATSPDAAPPSSRAPIDKAEAAPGPSAPHSVPPPPPKRSGSAAAPAPPPSNRTPSRVTPPPPPMRDRTSAPVSAPPPPPVRDRSAPVSVPPPPPKRDAASPSQVSASPPPAPRRAAASPPPEAEKPAPPALFGEGTPTAQAPEVAASPLAGAPPPIAGGNIPPPVTFPPQPVVLGDAPQARAPIPTLSDDPTESSTTLRPPGAVPPPPRGLPGPVTYEPAAPPPAAAAASLAPEASVLIAGLSRGEVEHYPSGPEHAEPEGEAPEPRQPATIPPARSTNVDSLTAGTRPKSKDRSRLLALGLGLLSVLLAITLVVSLLTRPSESPEAAPDASASAGAVKPRRTVGCRLAAPAARLAPSVERSVPPRHLALDDGRIALGFASTATQANGILIDPSTLDVRKFFEQLGALPVRGVAPMTGATFTFVADRDSDGLTAPSSLEMSPRTLIGFTPEGLARGEPGADPQLIWETPGMDGAEVTECRTLKVGDEGHAVVFRRGGLSGSVLVGWLKPDLSGDGDLEAIPSGVRFVGTPSIAASKDKLLVAFAGRNAENEPWGIRLALADAGEVPDEVLEFPVPEGGLNGGAIAPAVAALGDRWVLQWTQGGSGKYEVRVQELDAELKPLGEAVPTSPKGANAGQGAVGVSGKKALSVYVLTVAGRDELWGAALECR